MYEAASEARKRTAEAMSSGSSETGQRNLPVKLSRAFLRQLVRHVRLDKARRDALTVMPREASSRAAAFVKPITPALAAT